MTVAAELNALTRDFLGVDLPVRLRAWDGSQAGPDTTVTLHLRDKNALRRLMWHPNELGLAQAYIQGEIEVDGGLSEGLRAMWQLATVSRAAPGRLAVAKALPFALRHGLLGPRPTTPDPQAKLDGQVHTRQRDKAAVSFHYDLSNDFYATILDPHLVYSCAYWTHDEPGYGLRDAQRDKLDLICRKLDLKAGDWFLDAGCGWGALAIHAAVKYGVNVVAVTLSKRQYDFATARARELGIDGQVRFRHGDFRDIPDKGFHAIASVEMGEHIGAAGYPRFALRLRQLLKPRGRLLLQQMSRGASHPGGGAFIESYIAPDMHMRPVGHTVGLLEGAGLEVRDVEAMREHYVRTVAAWNATLDERWDEVVERFGAPLARVWRLYLTGGALAFEQGRMGVDQILAVACDRTGGSGMPAVPGWMASSESGEACPT